MNGHLFILTANLIYIKKKTFDKKRIKLSSIIFIIQWRRYLDFDRVIAPIWNYPPLSKRAYNELLHIIHITVAPLSSQGSSYGAYEFKDKSTPDKLANVYTHQTKITTNAEIIIHSKCGTTC